MKVWIDGESNIYIVDVKNDFIFCSFGAIDFSKYNLKSFLKAAKKRGHQCLGNL